MPTLPELRHYAAAHGYISDREPTPTMAWVVSFDEPTERTRVTAWLLEAAHLALSHPEPDVRIRAAWQVAEHSGRLHQMGAMDAFLVSLVDHVRAAALERLLPSSHLNR